MGNSKTSKMIVQDIRQSKGWSEYLTFLGWNSVRTFNDINIEIRKVFFGGLVKIQRPKSISKNDLIEITEICKKNRALFIKLEPSLGQDLKILTDYGYVKSASPLLPPTTIFINLTNNEKALWNSVSHSGKYSVNRARREGTNVEFFQNPSEKVLKSFYDIHKQTGNKKGFYIENFEDIKKKVEIFKDESFVINVKDKEGAIMGANFYLGFDKNIWFMHGATSHEGRKSKAGYELVWKSFLYFKGLGYEILDLEGKDDKRFPNFTKGWGGFSHFKEKFGGREIIYPEPHIKYLNPLLSKFGVGL